MSSSDAPLARLDDRLALRANEAADALGISVRKLRELRSVLPVVRVGGVVLYPVESLREWLREQAEVEGARVDRITKEFLEEL